MIKLKRRDFLKMIGGFAISIPAILIKANPTQFISPVDGLDIGLELPMGICKITSREREEAERISRSNLLFNRKIIKASDICTNTLSRYGYSFLYSDCHNCPCNCQRKKID